MGLTSSLEDIHVSSTEKDHYNYRLAITDTNPGHHLSSM